MATVRDGVTAVADGVLRISRADVNCYLVLTEDGPVLVDAGLPGSWSLLGEALASVGQTPDDLVSVYLTHGHFDHVGMGDRLGREHDVPLHVHAKDQWLARHPYRYAQESSRWTYPFRHPRAVPALSRMVAAGALGVRGVDALGDVRPGEVGTGFGGLTPIFTPGHTFGHCAFFLPDRGVLFSGDALVTLDPYTGATGPRVVARAATADSAAGFEALQALAETDAPLVLPGHGSEWREGVRSAVQLALAAGIA